jgi:hypothetical protein
MKHIEKRYKSITEALPFIGMLAALAALIGLLIWVIESFGEK